MTAETIELETINYFVKHLSLPENISFHEPLSEHLKDDGAVFRYGIALMNFFELHNLSWSYEIQNEFSEFPDLKTIAEYVKNSL